ncbi:beta-carotene 15,15'-dioxygenase, Brp/Blh family [Litorimonas sp. WD9-15]|uniref:beta-carotene 15,15'-dioxygenase, Brp/Blh family n=1 Tax=Litorimonas sp. WD9-15 TaxID=3418716 RepID=UPI003D033704
MSWPASLSKRSVWIAFTCLCALGFYAVQSVSPVAAFWLAIFFFILGVPHGAVERLPHQRRVMMPTLAYTALYIVFGILVYSSWLISPVGTLVVFLTLSAIHFGLSEPHILSLGAWVTLGSFLNYPVETLEIFSFLTRSDLSVALAVETGRYFSIICALIVLGETAIRLLRRQSVDLFRVIALLTIFIFLPPVTAVALYFFCFHSLCEMRKTLEGLSRHQGYLDLKSISKLYAPASIPALIGAGIIIWAVQAGYVPIYLAAGLGVAFIIPHMLPVEKLLELDRA